MLKKSILSLFNFFILTNSPFIKNSLIDLFDLNLFSFDLSIVCLYSFFFLFLGGITGKLWAVDNWELCPIKIFFLALQPSRIFWLNCENILNLESAFSIFSSVIIISFFFISSFSLFLSLLSFSFCQKILILLKIFFISLNLFEYLLVLSLCILLLICRI